MDGEDAQMTGVYRRHYGKLVAILTRLLGVRRLDDAESIAQEAFVKALQTWPFEGFPASPEAWLTTVAKNRALDVLRGERTIRTKEDALAHEIPAAVTPDEAFFEGELADDQLRMVLACCHPALGRDAQVALTLKTVCGLSVKEIAAAFLVPEPTISQRLVRAKHTLRDRDVTLAVPVGAELAERLEIALEVLYLLFNAGYAATEGEDPIKAELAGEAIRLTELLCAHETCGTPTAHAAAALFCFQASRFEARTDDYGELLVLEEQDRSLWDRRLIALGFRHLHAAAKGDELTPLHLEAGIAALHASATTFAATDWTGIIHHYDELHRRSRSPVVALNRAVAVLMRDGPDAALNDLAPLAKAGVLETYAPYHIAVGEAKRRQGDLIAAKEAYARAARFAGNAAERRFLAKRLHQLEE